MVPRRYICKGQSCKGKGEWGTSTHLRKFPYHYHTHEKKEPESEAARRCRTRRRWYYATSSLSKKDGSHTFSSGTVPCHSLQI